MNTVVYFAIMLFLPGTSSQPTYDDEDGSCQTQDNAMLTLLQREVDYIKNELSHVKRILARQENKEKVNSCE